MDDSGDTFATVFQQNEVDSYTNMSLITRTTHSFSYLWTKMSNYDLVSLVDWTYSGVDHTLPGNGGPECIGFIPTHQKILETIFFVTISVLEMMWAYPRLKVPKTLPPTERPGDRTGKRIFLMLMSMTFGIELGFKFATRQMLWILNPCHLVTIMQIFLLTAPPSRLAMAVFRVHMHCLSGATIAVIFPVINTRLLPFEIETYYIQHVLILAIPYYLMRVGGVYTPEPLFDCTWSIFTIGALFFYHWVLLQPLAMLSHVNLNNMMCPAVSDPFYGPWYRVGATIHQTALLSLHGKAYTWIAQQFLPPRHLQWERGNESNGHAKLH